MTKNTQRIDSVDVFALQSDRLPGRVPSSGGYVQ
ncbi:hypothetical protein CLU89_3008 [Acidovorax sp. 30]|nr:hypothetical protein CLU87_1555 [Acidovorax sp. 59]PKW03349.1 hypothetical protein CLU89_3008 [Acidovorax sp. 30]